MSKRGKRKGAGPVAVLQERGHSDRGDDPGNTYELQDARQTEWLYPACGAVVINSLKGQQVKNAPEAFGISHEMLYRFIVDAYPMVKSTYGLSHEFIKKDATPAEFMERVMVLIKEKSKSQSDFHFVEDDEHNIRARRLTWIRSFSDGFCFPVEYVPLLKGKDQVLYECMLAALKIFTELDGSTWEHHQDWVMESFRQNIADLDKKVKGDREEIEALEAICYEYEKGKVAKFHKAFSSIKNAAAKLRILMTKLDPRNEIHHEAKGLFELLLAMKSTGHKIMDFDADFSDEWTEDRIRLPMVFGIIWSLDDAFDKEIDSYYSEMIGNYGLSDLCLVEYIDDAPRPMAQFFVDNIVNLCNQFFNLIQKFKAYENHISGSKRAAGTFRPDDYLQRDPEGDIYRVGGDPQNEGRRL